MKTILNTANEAAAKASRLIMKHFGKLKFSQVNKKAKNELVSFIDTTAEKIIKRVILKKYPEHDFLGEETGLSGKKGDNMWIVDPLDGTTNYVNGIPQFCVSIGFVHNSSVQVGLVYDPVKSECFTATKGGISKLNGRRIFVSAQKALEESLIGYGTPYRLKYNRKKYYEIYGDIQKSVRDQRRMGSAALDLCYVACGRFSAFWEVGLAPWDIAAGMLMVEAAGGTVTDFRNKPCSLDMPHILASNGIIHDKLIRKLKSF
ncbi:MAG: inositol monophosphatase family protein [bacterium]